MDHAGHHGAVFGLDRHAEAPVALGDDRVLQVGPGAAVDEGGQLGADPLVCRGDGAAHLPQRGTCVVGDLLLGEDAAADLAGEGGEGLDAGEEGLKGIGRELFVPLCPGLDPGAGVQQLGGLQQFSRAHGAADLQALKLHAQVAHPGEGDAACLKDAA